MTCPSNAQELWPSFGISHGAMLLPQDSPDTRELKVVEQGIELKY